jgi:dTDP-4-dehydrorhamnose 3,5-epimerase-like enzyme
VQLWRGVQLEDDVFVGPNATFTNDPLPRSRVWLEEHPMTIVRAGASIGANATILPGLEIGRGALVGAGAVVTRSVPPHAIITGNPGRIHGYVETAPRTDEPVRPTVSPGRIATRVRDVYLYRFPEFADLRGTLTAGDLPADSVPFAPRRWFLVHNVPSREVRGEHAHRECHQFLVCVAGSVRVVVDDGQQRAEILLDSPSLGVYVPPLVWASQFGYGPDSCLFVFASNPYDPDDYIREYESFLSEVALAVS